MANPSHDQGGSPPPPARRSRTRRDPSADEVYKVPAQDFAHTVQRLTGAASHQAPSTPSCSSSNRSAPPPPSTGPPPAPALHVSTARSMQEAYLAWCASNNVLLSPGTMAEMDRSAEATKASPASSSSHWVTDKALLSADNTYPARTL